MLRSMYSGISGMKANQTRMDVVGNNVANVGTTAFKKSSVRFSDTLSQMVIYASKPGGNMGGVNPGQVGLGVNVAAISKNMLQGSLQRTGISSDLAIDGEGFFVIQIGKQTEGADDGVIAEAYTRDGAFNVDENGMLVTAEGNYVVGVDEKPIEIFREIDDKRVISYNISKEGRISYVLEDGSKVEEVPVRGEDGQLTEEKTKQALKIATFNNPNGLESQGGNLYIVSSNSGEPIYNNADGVEELRQFGSVIQGALEMSNVDLSEEFTEMIVTTRAFQASSKVITTSDELLQEIINLKR